MLMFESLSGSRTLVSDILLHLTVCLKPTKIVHIELQYIAGIHQITQC